MMAEIQDGRCWRVKSLEEGPPLIQAGNLTLQVHHVGWLASGIFTLVATVASLWLINKHLQWYTNKREQRYIVRLLFMIPIYSIISLASYFFWDYSTPLILLRDCYESFVLAAFFYLLLNYISPDPEEQQRVFLKKGISKQADREAARARRKPRRWIFPLIWVKWKPQDGMYFLQIQKWGVLQYTVVRPITTLAAVILDYVGLYCESSWNPKWAHPYIVSTMALSVAIAMYCLIQLYVSVATELAPHKPLLKLFSVTAVVFLTFWQATILSLFSMVGVVQDSDYMTAEDISIAIAAVLETFEMMIFAFIHLKAFTYKPYQPTLDSKIPMTRTSRWRSLCNAMDFRETFREIWQGIKYMWARMRGRQPAIDTRAMRVSHFTEAFEHARPSHLQGSSHQLQSTPIKTEKVRKPSMELGERRPTLPKVEIQMDQTTEVDIGGERQWLGTGDDYGYGLSYLRREKSETLGVQIQKELARRGYVDQDISGRAHLGKPPEDEENPGHGRRRRSWWRSLYNRFSQSGQEDDREHLLYSSSKHVQHGTPHPRGDPAPELEASHRLLSEYDHNFSDPPPGGLLRPYANRFNSGRVISGTQDLPPPQNGAELDMLAPLSVFSERKSSQHQRTSKAVALSRPQSTSPDPPAASQATSSGPESTTAPTSELLQRSDSLLGRVFPALTDPEVTDVGHLSDSASGHRLQHSQVGHDVIRRSPPIVPINMAGERSIIHSTVPPLELLPTSAQISQAGSIPSSPTRSPRPLVIPVSSPSQVSPPIPMQRGGSLSPSSPISTSPVSDAPSQLQDDRRKPVKPNHFSADSQGLRRSPAKVYARDARDSRQFSLPTPSPSFPSSSLPSPSRRTSVPIPESTHIGTSSNSRRLSAPPTPLHRPKVLTVPRPLSAHHDQSSQDAGSEITQPSYSGTKAANKYPSQGPLNGHHHPQPRQGASRHPHHPTGLPQPMPLPQILILPPSRPLLAGPPSSPPAHGTFYNVHMRPPPSVLHPNNSRPHTNRNDIFPPFSPPS